MEKAIRITQTEKRIRLIGVIGCQLFAVITFVLCIKQAELEELLLAGATVVLVLIPGSIERWFDCKISLPAYLFCLFYAVGPMIGVCYDFYVRIVWWDKMLHIFGGIAFAVLGLFLFETFVPTGKKRSLFAALFAISFSIAVSAVWEFAEFGADQFLGMDMQSDWILDSIHSDSIRGITETVDYIERVTVNGKELPINGYLDVGLTDTMLDMLLESAGAVIIVALCLLNHGKNPALVRKHPSSFG